MKDAVEIPENARRVVCYQLPDGTLVPTTQPPGSEPGVITKPLVALGKRPEDCSRWIGTHLPNGYGKKQHNGKALLAHRWMWTMHFGPIPDGLVITHSCGTLNCVNPHHLVLTTQAECIRNGVGAVLTSGDVREIRQRHKAGWRVTDLGAHYGVEPQTVSAIISRKTWKTKAAPFKPQGVAA